MELHAAVYRHSHDERSRVWFTFDKEEILSAADLSYSMMLYKREQELKELNNLKPIPYNTDWDVMLNSPEREALIAASEQAEEELMRAGEWESWHLYSALMKYPHLSIKDALIADAPLIRAFALFDRRVGKRRLIKIDHFEHPIEEKFFQIRCIAEGLNRGEEMNGTSISDLN